MTKQARGVLAQLKDVEAKTIKDGLVAFVIPEKMSLLRSDIFIRLKRANVYVVSLQRQGASTLERLEELASELDEVRAAKPAPISKALLQHPQTVATLQLLARLSDSIGKLSDPTRPAAGDARLVDTLALIKRHLELIKARGFELPAVTREVVVERFDWQGDHYATGSRYLHTELLGTYRTTFAAIARDTRKAAKNTVDARAREQYLALGKLAESLHQAIAAALLPRR